MLSLLLACLAVASIAGAQQPELTAEELSDEDLVILEVKLDGYVLEENFLAYMQRGSLLLPLGELAQLLDLPILVDAHAGRADGWFIRESRGFHLDLARSQVVISGAQKSFDASLVVRELTELYVDSSLVSSWLGIQFELILSALELRLHPSEKLPIQLRLLRDERRRRSLMGVRRQELPRRSTPYRLATWPTLDLTVQTHPVGDRAQTSYTFSGAADLAGLSTQVSASGNDVVPVSTLRLVASRTDIDGGLLGPLRARNLAAGDVSAPPVPLVSRSRDGPGVFVSNSLLAQPDEFGFTSVRGVAPEGWDVELYRNGSLTDFLIVDASGRYEFPRVELGFGENVLRSVAYGPQGQVRERVERHRIGAGLLLPGQLRYRLFAVRPERALLDSWIHGLRSRSATGAWDLHARLAYGIGHRLSVSGSLTRTEVAGQDETFATLGVQASSLGVSSEMEMARSSAGGRALKLSAQTRFRGISLLAQQSEFRSYTSNAETGALPLSRQTLLRATGSATLPHLPTLAYNLGYERRSFETSGASDEQSLSFRVASNLRGVSFAHELTAEKTGGVSRSFRRIWSQGLISGRWRGFQLRGRAQYEWKPDRELDVITATVSRKLRRDLSTSLVVTRSLGDSATTKLSARMSWIARKFELSLELGQSSVDGTTATLTIGSSFGREPRTGRVLLSRPGLASGGTALIRVYLDRNANDQFDAGDEPIPGVSFLGNASWRATKTNADGHAFLRGIPVNRPHDVRLDPASVIDPYWIPAVSGYSVVAHPGGRVELDFPIRLAGEIDGTVYMERAGERRTRRNLGLELVDTQGSVVQTTRSAFDGYFLFERVLPGEYRIRVAEGALKDPTIRTHELELEVPSDGGVVAGLALILRAGDAVRSDTEDRSDTEARRDHEAETFTKARPDTEDRRDTEGLPKADTEPICSTLARVLLDLGAWRPGPDRELGDCARARRAQASSEKTAAEPSTLEHRPLLDPDDGADDEGEDTRDVLPTFEQVSATGPRRVAGSVRERGVTSLTEPATLTDRAPHARPPTRRTEPEWRDAATAPLPSSPALWTHTAAQPRGPPWETRRQPTPRISRSLRTGRRA